MYSSPCACARSMNGALVVVRPAPVAAVVMAESSGSGLHLVAVAGDALALGIERELVLLVLGQRRHRDLLGRHGSARLVRELEDERLRLRRERLGRLGV